MRDPQVKWWVLGGSLVVLLPLLGCGGLFAALKWSEFSCRRDVENARTTVRTDTKPIRAELAPLGVPAEVHWVLEPDRHCEMLPTPGTDRDSQSGVVKLDPAQAEVLVGRYAGWEAARPGGSGLLSPYIPSGGTWQRTDELDAQFVGAHSGEEARYYVNVDNGAVLFSSYADHAG
ncbi:hypothetical protein ACPPVO_52110 [Dactylosporangium sp. McL0621]|uniref:hypothetical protein n=1 Tax=Dactylosporangium sp. McL0621 TaxID=3415678 RepID=UPI003CEABF8C